MEHLMNWRLHLGLSRQQVVDRLTPLLPEATPAVDQATLAKWESGETAVRVEDIMLLAKVYGVSADRLFFVPTDEATPALMQRAVDVIQKSLPKDVETWMQMGEALSRKN